MNKTLTAPAIGVFLFSVPLSNGGAWLSHRKNDVRPTTPANTAIRSSSNRELQLALEALIHETFSEIHETEIEHSGAG